MAEREPPEPTPREAPEAREPTRAPVAPVAPAGPTPQPEATTSAGGTAQAFWRRIDRMERALRDTVGATRELAHRVAAGSEAIPMVADLAREVSSTLERFRVELEAVRGELSRRVPAAVEERLSRVTSELGDMITTALRSTTEAAGERTSGALDGLRAAITGIEERVSGAISGGHEATQVRLTAALDALTTQLRTLEERLQERLAEAVGRATEASDQRLTSALETLTAGAESAQAQLTAALEGTGERISEALAPMARIPGQLSEAMDAVREGIGEMATAQTEVDERLEALRTTTLSRINEIESGLADALAAVGGSVREDQDRATERFSEVLTARIEELRSVVGSLFGTGIEALDTQVRGLVTRVDEIARQTEEAGARVDEAARRAAQGVASGATEGARRAAEQVARRVDEAVSKVSDDVDVRLAGLSERVDDAVQGIADRSDRLAELLEATFTAVEARLSQATAPLSRTVDAAVGSVREAVSALDLSLQNVIRRVGSSIGEVRGELTSSVGNLGGELTTMGQTIDGLRDEMHSLRTTVDTFRQDAGSLGDALGQVAHMRDALDSLSKRRGLRELAEADRLVAEQQTAFVAQMTGAGEQLTARLVSLEEQLRAAVDSGELSRLQTEVTQRIGAELEQLRTSVAEEVERRISEAVTGVLEGVRAQIAEAIPATVGEAVGKQAAEAMPGKAVAKDVREIAKMQRDLDKTVSTLKSDLGDIKRRVASWGRARGAPKLAEELVALEERIGDVEGLVQEDLVDAVFERMQRAFDRRFDALVQLIDARLQQHPDEPSLVDQRRGIFRRRE